MQNSNSNEEEDVDVEEGGEEDGSEYCSETDTGTQSKQVVTNTKILKSMCISFFLNKSIGTIISCSSVSYRTVNFGIVVMGVAA
jgi:hypothetical protein